MFGEAEATTTPLPDWWILPGVPGSDDIRQRLAFSVEWQERMAQSRDFLDKDHLNHPRACTLMEVLQTEIRLLQALLPISQELECERRRLRVLIQKTPYRLKAKDG